MFFFPKNQPGNQLFGSFLVEHGGSNFLIGQWFLYVFGLFGVRFHCLKFFFRGLE